MVSDKHSGEDLAMSWQEVMELFPYGLPASLRPPRPWGPNVIDFAEWRRQKQGKVPSCDSARPTGK
jgi:hypothetical protein